MKKIINSIVYGIFVLGALVVSVPMSAQSFLADMPSAAFQSTSTMDGSGSAYTSNPSLDENGTANYPSAASNVPPRNAKFGLPDAPTPEDSGNTPIGDAVVPLLLMALVYAFVRYNRKQRFNAFAF